MTMPASPPAASARACRRAAAFSEPVSRATRVASSAPPRKPPSLRSPSRPTIERWCCCASTSVGASSAACPPESTTWSIARSATTVLPDPTSPWSSRCIGCPCPSSSAISSPTERCPAVSANGSRSSNRSSRPALRAGSRVGLGALDRGPAPGQHGLGDEGFVVLEPVAGPVTCAKLSGRWIQRSAWWASRSSSAARTSAGSTSGTSSTRSSAKAIVSSNVQVEILPISGYSGIRSGSAS